jgi:hypothetical protein
MGLNRFYLYQGYVVVPTVAQSEEGFYMDVEPIQVCDSNLKDKLHGLLVEALEGDNPVVPTPHVHEKGSSAVLERLGLKKWMHFEKLATMYTVYKNDQNIFVYRTARGPDELWTKDDAGDRSFPTGDAESVSIYIMADMAALEALKPAPLGLPGPVSRGILLAPPRETRNV